MEEESPKGIELWFGKPLAMLIFFIGMPWALLTISDQGLLVGTEKFTGTFGDESLRCTYFIGIHTETTTHLRFHVPTCPIFQNIPD